MRAWLPLLLASLAGCTLSYTDANARRDASQAASTAASSGATSSASASTASTASSSAGSVSSTTGSGGSASSGAGTSSSAGADSTASAGSTGGSSGPSSSGSTSASGSTAGSGSTGGGSTGATSSSGGSTGSSGTGACNCGPSAVGCGVVADGGCDPSGQCYLLPGSASDGTSCADGGERVCVGGSCLSGCWYDGALPDGGGFVGVGGPSPLDACALCDPAGVQPYQAQGVPCDGGFAGACNGAGACVASCFIAGAEVGAGAADPAQPCRVCDPARATTAWSPSGDACAFPDGGAGACSAGACVPGCSIGGAFLPPFGTFDAGCEVCVPSLGAAATQQLLRFPCGAGSAGRCYQGACYFDGGFEAASGLPPAAVPDSTPFCSDGYPDGGVDCAGRGAASPYWGQDGDVDTGAPGLLAEGDLLYDPGTGLLWDTRGTTAAVTYASVSGVCAGINHGLAGPAGSWSTPTPVEVGSLLDFGLARGNRVNNAVLWARGGTAVFTMSAVDGVQRDTGGADGTLWCVRAGSARGPALADAGSGEVLDARTGLAWSSGVAPSYAAALSSCPNGGHLASAKELLSVLDPAAGSATSSDFSPLLFGADGGSVPTSSFSTGFTSRVWVYANPGNANFRRMSDQPPSPNPVLQLCVH